VGEAVERFLIRTQAHLPETQPAEAGASPPLSSYSATPAQQGRTQARLLRKWKVYQRVKELHAEGMSLRRIGEELGLARSTVRKYFREPPEPPRPVPRAFRASLLDPKASPQTCMSQDYAGVDISTKIGMRSRPFSVKTYSSFRLSLSESFL
jgi:hypothetical protein